MAQCPSNTGSIAANVLAVYQCYLKYLQVDELYTTYVYVHE